MKKMSQIAKEQLCLLAENPELLTSIDAVKWKPGNRLRIILELDIYADHVDLHGYEFRYRNPGVRMIPDSVWETMRKVMLK